MDFGTGAKAVCTAGFGTPQTPSISQKTPVVHRWIHSLIMQRCLKRLSVQCSWVESARLHVSVGVGVRCAGRRWAQVWADWEWVWLQTRWDDEHVWEPEHSHRHKGGQTRARTEPGQWEGSKGCPQPVPIAVPKLRTGSHCCCLAHFLLQPPEEEEVLSPYPRISRVLSS